MKIPKEIALKAAAYEEAIRKADNLREELESWLEKNTDMMEDGYIHQIGVAQEPEGEEQRDGEWCDQYQRGEDYYVGTYYWPIEESTQYMWVNYSC